MDNQKLSEMLKVLPSQGNSGVNRFGDEYDIKRIEMLGNGAELLDQLTSDDNQLTLLLKELVRRKMILLMDEEGMVPFTAYTVTLLKDGRILLTNPR